MNSKSCFKCGLIKPLSKFYRHSEMADGHLNKCIECAKKDVKQHYDDPKNRQKYIAYEKRRFKDPKRKAKVKFYARRQDPLKRWCRSAFNNALRYGHVKRKPCEKCGDVNSQGHHQDYKKPLSVQWLCRKHHMEAHGRKATVEKPIRILDRHFSSWASKRKWRLEHK